MKVFYTCSLYGKSKYQHFYDLVLETIKKYSDDVISPEMNNYLGVIKESERKKIKDLRKIHYLAIKKGIQMADVVIIEISEEGFQLGHEATVALMNKKPVLCLSINEDMSLKIDSPYFYGAKYNVDNIDEIVASFLHRFGRSNLRNRFNMFLTSAQVAYLDEAAKKKDMNTSEYVRWLIDKDRGIF